MAAGSDNGCRRLFRTILFGRKCKFPSKIDCCTGHRENYLREKKNYLGENLNYPRDDVL